MNNLFINLFYKSYCFIKIVSKELKEKVNATYLEE